MSRSSHNCRLFFVIGFAAACLGCAKEPAPAPPAVAEEKIEGEIVEEVEVPELKPADVNDAMAALGETDRAAALAQKICPVSDEPLGGMGTPIKVTVKGRDVFLCCEGCRKELEADPDKFLAKLDAK